MTDSRYLHDGMTSWMAGWKRKDRKTASGDPVKNKKIWVQLDAAASDHEQVRWHWVKGHIGHALNERADLLAVAATRNAAHPGADIRPWRSSARAGRSRPSSRCRRYWTETTGRRPRARASCATAAAALVLGTAWLERGYGTLSRRPADYARVVANAVASAPNGLTSKALA